MRGSKSIRRSAGIGFASIVILFGSSMGVASADESGFDSTAEIVESVTGATAQSLTEAAPVGDFLTVEPASEVESTLIVQEGDQTSVVAAIEEGDDTTTVSFALNLEPGYVLSLTPDGGGVVFNEADLAAVQAAGEDIATEEVVNDLTLAVAGTLDAPWAVDAIGARLPTSYALEGNTLVQHVDTSDAVFPVAADPSFGVGWQGAIPVTYYHYTWSETTSIATYSIPTLSGIGWLCDWLPGVAVSACRSLMSSRAADLVNTAKSAVSRGRCLSIWQGAGGPVTWIFYDAYTRVC